MDRRQEIIEAALKSFSLFGYKATTMDQVAKIANVGKGTIYTFFTNKEELFRAIVMKMIEDLRIETDQAVDLDASFAEKAHGRLMHILQFREKHLLYAKLMDEEKELRTPAVTEVLGSIEEAILSYIAEKIEKAVNKGEIKQCDPEIIAFLLFKSYVALVVDWNKTHERELDEKTIVTLISETIFKSLMH